MATQPQRKLHITYFPSGEFFLWSVWEGDSKIYMDYTEHKNPRDAYDIATIWFGILPSNTSFAGSSTSNRPSP